MIAKTDFSTCCVCPFRGTEPCVHPRRGRPLAAPLQRRVRRGRRRAAAPAAPAGAARAPRPPAAAAGQVVPLGDRLRKETGRVGGVKIKTHPPRRIFPGIETTTLIFGFYLTPPPLLAKFWFRDSLKGLSWVGRIEPESYVSGRSDVAVFRQAAAPLAAISFQI